MSDPSTPPSPSVPPAPTRPTEPPLHEKRSPRTWPQRVMIGTTFVLAIGSFGAAGALYAGQRVVEDRNLAPKIIDPSRATTTEPAAGDAETEGAAADVTAPPETFPPAEPNAKNFLITGADNNSCVDPDSPYAPAFGDRTGFGERSDTIMMWRINPSTSQVAVLSFPRDLYVQVAGSSRKGRINEAYERDNPQKLIDTIYQNFGVNTDHFVQVDFCTFQTLVEAVDGVAVPFDTPIRDPNTGLNVTEPGCFTFDGDHALAYVRSRKLEYLNADGEWKQDPTSDLGRISRQQDFLRRTVSRLLNKGAFNPDVAGGLIEAVSEYIVTDEDLTPRKMLEFAGVMSRVDPVKITTYQINATGTTVSGASVLVPAINGDNMQSILRVFRGEATLADAPDQVLDTTTAPDDTTTPTATTPSDTAPSDTAPSDPAPAGTVPDTTGPDADLPSVVAEQNTYGVIPDPNISC